MITAWIDATRPAACWQLWGMSLVERQLRQLALRGAASVHVAVGGNGAPGIRADFASRYDLDIRFHRVSGEAGFGPSLEAVESPLAPARRGRGVRRPGTRPPAGVPVPGNSVDGRRSLRRLGRFRARSPSWRGRCLPREGSPGLPCGRPSQNRDTGDRRRGARFLRSGTQAHHGPGHGPARAPGAAARGRTSDVPPHLQGGHRHRRQPRLLPPGPLDHPPPGAHQGLPQQRHRPVDRRHLAGGPLLRPGNSRAPEPPWPGPE